MEKMVVYRALYGERKLYVRPYDMFLEEVNRDGGFYMEDLTFINRLVTEININKSTWEEKLEKVDDATTRMINLLLEKIIPYAIKNKKINLSPAQLEDILSLVTYEKLDLKSSQKSQNEIKKVKRRIDKSKK